LAGNSAGRAPRLTTTGEPARTWRATPRCALGVVAWTTSARSPAPVGAACERTPLVPEAPKRGARLDPSPSAIRRASDRGGPQKTRGGPRLEARRTAAGPARASAQVAGVRDWRIVRERQSRFNPVSSSAAARRHRSRGLRRAAVAVAGKGSACGEASVRHFRHPHRERHDTASSFFHPSDSHPTGPRSRLRQSGPCRQTGIV